MKTKLLLTSLLSVIILLNGCSEIKNRLSKENTSSTSKNNREEQIYKINEEWIVDNQWKLKITEVRTTPYRNRLNKDVSQVVIIKYTYENLGFKGMQQDLFLTPTIVLDSANNSSQIYPIHDSKYPKPTPIGTISESIMGYSLNVESEKIKIIFEQFDSNAKKIHKATFEIPVTK